MVNYSSWGLLLENFTLGHMNNGNLVVNGLKKKPEVIFVDNELVNWQPVAFHQDGDDMHLRNNENIDEGDDLLVALRKPLCVGVMLGLIPIRGMCKQEKNELKFRWFHWRTILTATITFLVACNIILISKNFIKILLTTQRVSPGEMVFAFSGVWFYTAGMAVYLFFLFRSKDLINYFDLWKEISIKIHSTLIPDTTIQCHLNLITFLILGSCVGENIMFHFHMMSPQQRERLSELTLDGFLRDYYNWNNYMYTFFSYSPLISLLVFIVNKLTLYAWNFGDVILILLSRVLYGRFEGLNQYLEHQFLSQDNGNFHMIKKGAVSWKCIRLNFLAINELVEEGNRIFAPMIWLSYITDIFFVCNQLYIELSPSSNERVLVSSIYVIWSFLHLIMRTLAVNMMGAKVNESAHRINHLLQHCYPEEYNNDVRRLEEYLGSHEIGLSGNGCFVITRSFILMIISAIFTLEVVLLQSGHAI